MAAQGRTRLRQDAIADSMMRRDAEVAGELEEFVTLQLSPHRADRLDAVYRQFDRNLAEFYHELEEDNADFDALQRLDEHADLFSESELKELRALLGLYGMEISNRLQGSNNSLDYSLEKQQHWLEIHRRAREPARQAVAERAAARYGLILGELHGG